MAFDPDLYQRAQAVAMNHPDMTEKKMFGGLSFLYKGKMTIGIVKDELAVRVVESKMDEEMEKPFTRPMNFTGKSMKEFIYVSQEGCKGQEALQYWFELGLEHAKSKLDG